MVEFKRRGRKSRKFHGPNPAKPADSGDSSPDSKIPDKPNPKIKCGEQEDCPLRSKCKAGICP
jgi:hypothetical protein